MERNSGDSAPFTCHFRVQKRIFRSLQSHLHLGGQEGTESGGEANGSPSVYISNGEECHQQ